ncbi:diaminopimelate epimerase [Vitreoscilla sp. C1]|uniref:diaminopimelate epimerase n=1 Tax=Vitreoscilla sp. (strain C1) TaxID=96942 RepID=UPI000CDC4441|nr:diaminopimelate epimerase [Vitreoscilla sp. C1]AUZ04535.1 diaminopimelate epimerase [Vitreoscilla sp. C1]
MNTLKFTKMHGLGNDFLVVDATKEPISWTAANIQAWANRHTGVGFDQLLVIEPSSNERCDFKYRIFNADGSEVEQCGNGARCFAKYVTEHGLTDKKSVMVETMRGIIVLHVLEDGQITVDMGKPHFAPEEIPYVPSSPTDHDAMAHVLIVRTDTVTISCVNMGNPHAVLLVDDIRKAPVSVLGEAIESHAQFPQKVNVGFAEIVSRDEINLRVFERGVGETQACGTGACAAAVAGIRHGLLNQNVLVNLPGGTLTIQWQEGESVLMTGPAAEVYSGVLTY